MTELLDEMGFLEALNPVPGNRGNPGPPADDAAGQAPASEPRRVWPLLGAAAALLLLIAGGAVMVRGTPAPEVALDTGAVQEASTDPSDDDAPIDEAAAGGDDVAGSATETDDVSAASQTIDDTEEIEPDVLRSEVVAQIEIAAIGLDELVLSGVDPEVLRRGVGHYSETPRPGEAGNAVLAGHRTTFGATFQRLDELSVGEPVIVTTSEGQFSYVVDQLLTVGADEVWVLDDAGDDRLTITTAHPEFSDAQRLVVVALLDKTLPAAGAGGPGNTTPFVIEPMPGGFVGLAASDELTWFPDPSSVTMIEVVTSADGLWWEPVVGIEPIRAMSAQIAVAGDVVHIVSVEQDDPDVSGRDLDDVAIGEALSLVHRQFVAAGSPVRLDGAPVPVPVRFPLDSPDPLTRLQVVDVATADAGLLATVVASPVWPPLPAEIADDAMAICELFSSGDTTRYRRCGEVDEIVIDHDPDGEYGWSDYRSITSAYLRSWSGSFEQLDLDAIQPDTPQWPVFAFSTGAELGLSIPAQTTAMSPTVFTTSDGLAWRPVESIFDAAPMVRVRDNVSIYRTQRPVRRYGANDRALGMAWSLDGGPWQPVELPAGYAGDMRRGFGPLEVGEAGWVMSTSRTLTSLEVPGLVRRAGPRLGFVIEADGYVLRGDPAPGPATLTAPSGEVVATWDRFEAAQPAFNGLEVTETSVIVSDPAGDHVVEFPRVAWAALQPDIGAALFDVLFSDDGISWQVIASGLGPVVDLDVAEDRVLVTHLPHGPELDVGSLALSTTPLLIEPEAP